MWYHLSLKDSDYNDDTALRAAHLNVGSLFMLEFVLSCSPNNSTTTAHEFFFYSYISDSSEWNGHLCLTKSLVF